MLLDITAPAASMQETSCITFLADHEDVYLCPLSYLLLCTKCLS